MKSITTFNGWLLNKISSYLSSKEGFTIETSSYMQDGIRTIVQDSFGFRYELQVKTLGRIQNHSNSNDLEVYNHKNA